MSAELNFDFYTGADYYSDGEVEEELLELVKQNDDFTEILAKDSRWPILYHLSPIRQNILNWYPFEKEASCLEIGGGCGAITGTLCENINKVTVVELSKRRARINYERHKSHDNLKIIVGNLNDIEFKEKFDYITLIGVLEYAGSFTKTEQPYSDFLKQIKTFLKPNGKLIIAIENRFGMKYFSGAVEDHTAKPFDGITGYTNNHSVRTFGKKELETLLSNNGYPKQDFYYPHPDYKMPMEIYSDAYLPKEQDFLSPAPNYDYEKYEIFNASEAYRGVIKNDQFEFFANSYLVICGD